MKHTFTTVFLATAGMALTVPTAQAQTPLSAKNGDLFIGFRAIGGTGATMDYLLDIGPASVFEDATKPVILSLGNVGADLTATFGSWQTDGNLLWGAGGTNTSSGVVAGADPKDTLFASAPAGSTAWKERPANAQGNTAGRFNLLSEAYVTNQSTLAQNDSTANSSFGLVQNDTDTDSWASYNDGISSFGAYSPDVENTFANGVAGATLDLFRMEPALGNPFGTELGTFSISSLGEITFSPIPEPSALAILAVGVGSFAFMRRRKIAAN